ncbi:MAG TPA: glycosyltransferase family 39 protein [Tepidisphaeraceae bacterium]|nr:glycosyltransferase family 39 protein [Tepidisphaeraceae bacterium]
MTDTVEGTSPATARVAPPGPAPTKDAPAGPSRQWWVALLCITAAAAALRLFAVSRHSFWYDEAVTAAVAEQSVGSLFTGETKDNGNPPLYWILARFWMLAFGNSEVAMRSLPVILGVASVPVMGLLGRRLLGPAAGLAAAALLAVSPLEIELANEARAYALQALLVILSTWLFVRWTDRRGWGALVAYAVSVSLACYTHYFSFFVPLAHGAALLLSREHRRLLPAWVGGMVLAALLWSPWLPAFWEQLRTPGNLSRMGDRWKLQFFATPVTFAVGRTFAWRDASKIMLLVALGGAMAAFWLPAAVGLLRSRRWFVGGLLLAWLALPVVLPLAAALAGKPLYHTRAASVAVPAFLLLLAAGLVRMAAAPRYAAVAVIGVMTAVSLYRYASLPLKDDWRAAAPPVLAGLQAGEVLLFDTDIEVTSFRYYAQKSGVMPQTMIGLTRGADPQGQLWGIRHANGVRVDRDEKEQGESVWSAQGIWVLLCVPASSSEEYRQLIESRGYRLVGSDEAHRIDVLHFRK